MGLRDEAAEAADDHKWRSRILVPRCGINPSDRCGDETYPVDHGMRVNAKNKDILLFVFGCVGLSRVSVGV